MAPNIATLGLLAPIIGLNGWTFIMEVWMYSTRIPAINKYYGGKISNTVPKERALDKLPDSVRWVAENYNHLFEQPTQFYAVTVALAIIAQHQAPGARVQVGDLDVQLAWTYVGIRVVHSFVQAVSNFLMLRFSLYAVSSVVLAAMTGRAGLALMDLSD